MLRGSVHLHLHGEGVVLAQDILHGVDVMLAHVSQAAGLIVPVPAEGRMHPVRMIGLVRGGAQPQVVVQFGRNGLGGEVGAAGPVELPGKTRRARNADRQGPAQQTAGNQFLEGFHRGTQAVERVFEAEPGVQAEDPSVPGHGLHHLLSFADGTGHGFLAENVLAGPGGLHGHDAVPVGRGGNVHDVHVGIVDEVTEVVIGGEGGAKTLLAGLDSSVQMALIHVADGYEAAFFIAGKVQGRHADAAHADDTPCELVAGSHIFLVAAQGTENVSGQNGKGRYGRARFFDK